MSGRRLKVLLGALAVLLAAWALARWIGGGPGGQPSQALALGAADDLELDSVVVTSGADTIRLRGGDRWTVNGHEAVSDAGESLARALDESRLGRLVSRNPENHERLGVTDEAGRAVTFYADDAPRLSVILGESAPAGGRYVRRAGAAEVYVLGGDLPFLAARDVESWRNREIVSVAREDVHRIEITYPDTSFALAREDDGWGLEPGGSAVKPAEVSALLGQLTSLRAIGFAADSVVGMLSWESPAASVRALGPGGSEPASLLFLDREDTGYYVRRSDGLVVYTISRFTGEQILRRPAELVADASTEPEAGVDPGSGEE